MTDHYDKAQARLKTTHFGDPALVVAEEIRTQTHAVLALAEQQRIANLVALISAGLGTHELQPEIARALRIEQDNEHTH